MAIPIRRHQTEDEWTKDLGLVTKPLAPWRYPQFPLSIRKRLESEGSVFAPYAP